ncbi:PREDICTED: expansin-like B1 [Tarenaya hassleriana]|uniref:expansin-like B1 n=1 Tax=Tarenaya hassleriana TaxID=28532 RepID=UPI00053C5C84|nr:PREDICTED: expansin-like B1 [Tarenaya hassleriana]
MKSLCFAALVLLLLPALSYCQSGNTQATIDGSTSIQKACKYGRYGLDANGGRVTGVNGALWRNGAGCGDCYQVICTNTQLCNSQGVTVLVTNQGGNDFNMAPAAFRAMARPGLEDRLVSAGVVGVSYQRVACRFPGRNVFVWLTDDTRPSQYLSLTLLNVGGVNDISRIQVMGAEGRWVTLTQVVGEVYATSEIPSGSLSVRVMFSGSSTWRQANNVIPRGWGPNQSYDTNFQVS